MARNRMPHIGIFGCRNSGKSSLVNMLCEQDISIVADIAGTTTDPVRKVMEITSVGPVVLIDTPGIDDQGCLGQLRIEKTLKVIKHINMAILVFTNNFSSYEEQLLEQFIKYELPFFIISNKNDLYDEQIKKICYKGKYQDIVSISTINQRDVYRELVFSYIRDKIPASCYKKRTILGDLVNENDLILLVVPIDSSAPEGRLILPQVQTIRDILDNSCVTLVCQETKLSLSLSLLKDPPALVVTDSQEFLQVAKIVPSHIPLTSFSILLARLKGDFEKYIEGTYSIDNLEDGDNILILESCSHHVTCEDIGRIKIPTWLSKFTGKKLNYHIVAGLDDIKNIKFYKLVIQCGGCVVTQKQLQNRLKLAIDNEVPVTNYGMMIAYVHGIFNRSVQVFKNKF